ncbi:hypothetical protein [Allobaculum sp. JKK-2023]|uniref:hypothetical protein n=1 Tax=Allobaculum sp. JKK-2023 TaxID=3108943 RepID=UPI002B056FF0|nr:hypothetical protein [Allobaculum sp. JKK-2023]
MADYVFSVPVNEQGIEDLEQEVEDSLAIHDYEMSEEEFKGMEKTGLLDKINQECGLNLARGRITQIPLDQADQVLKLLAHTGYENSGLAAALIDAQYFMTWVECVL